MVLRSPCPHVGSLVLVLSSQLAQVESRRRMRGMAIVSAAELRRILARHPNLSMITTRSGRDGPVKETEGVGEIPPSPPLFGGTEADSPRALLIPGRVPCLPRIYPLVFLALSAGVLIRQSPPAVVIGHLSPIPRRHQPPCCRFYILVAGVTMSLAKQISQGDQLHLPGGVRPENRRPREMCFHHMGV